MCCFLAVGVLVCGVTAFGQEIRWQPVSATCPYTMTDNIGNPGVASEMVLDMAPGCGDCEVTVEVKVSGWGSAPTTPELGAYQGRLLCPSLGSGTGDPLTQKTPWVDTAIIDDTRTDHPYYGTGPISIVYTDDCNFVFGSTPLMGPNAIDDGSTIYYGGEMVLVVTAGAAGTYELEFDPADTQTFFNNQTGGKIPGLIRTTGKITVPLGRCCYNEAANCEDDTAECYCLDVLGGIWEEGQLCPPAGPPCPSCEVDGDCDDSSVCTDDTCLPSGQCQYVPNYDPAYCCNPLTGALELIDDGNECTEDTCNEDTGVVTHDAAAMNGEPCTHANACVINDVCEDGVCVGDLPPSMGGDLEIPCADDSECPAGWFCNLGLGICDCTLLTPLCIFFDDVCYEEGDPVYASLQMGQGSSIVTGFQALMTYDPECLEFVGMGPCAGDDIFTTLVDSWVDEDAGKIWYAAIGLDEVTFEVTGFVGTYDLMCMEFIKLEGCDPCNMCIISDNPHNTLLVSDQGKNVELLLCDCAPGEEPDGICNCSGDIMLDGPITMTVPAGAEVNADCGLSTAEILWDAPYAEDECLGPLDLVCDLEHDGGVPLPPGLIMTGGVFPQGTTYFVCTATDEVCDQEITKVWTVNVSDQHTLDVEVHMQPGMANETYSRCICFDLYMDCVAPEHMCAVMDFGAPWNFLDHARAELKVDKGNYLCIEARDPYHTLRSTAAVECIDNKWTAVFKGDPLLGDFGDAHWLIGGNLDYFEPGGNPDVIDILDFGTFMFQYGEAFGPETCEMDDPQSDIDGSGLVDAGDYSYLMMNFLADSKLGCCEEAGAVDRTPITSITIKELRQRGLSHLAVADLNGDGVLDTADMEAFMQGATPTVSTKVQRTR